MTIQELDKLPFRQVFSLDIRSEKMVSFANDEYDIGYNHYIPCKDHVPCGQPYMRYRIGKTLYDSFDSFLEALEEI